MSAKYRLGNLLSSKASVTTQKFSSNLNMNRQKTVHGNKYVSLQQQEPDEYGVTRQKMDYRRRNHTESSKYYRLSAATLEVRNRLSEQRKNSFTNSKSVNLRNNKYLFQNQSSNKINDEKKDDRLLVIREEKIGKLKQIYNLKNRMGGQKKIVPSIISNSNVKFNSFKQRPKQLTQVTPQNKSKHKIIYHKNQQISKGEIKSLKSQRSLPKFFSYCEEHYQQDYKKHEQVNFGQNQLPKSLNSKTNRVKSLKAIAQTPPLIPVTLKSKDPLEHEFNLDWVKQKYQPQLQIFQQISMQKFKMKRVNGGFYFGELKQNTQIRDGKGFIFYQNGKIYEGHFVNDHKQGLGYQLYPDRSFYLGNFHQGKREGKGRFQWNNGQVYEGQWKGGKKQGSGIWKGSDGLSYVGQWQGDIIEGFGVLVDKGIRYEGQFKNFMKWGNGTIRFQNGETYTGMFKQNLANGIGDYYWTNGDHYHGEFANGKRHGDGFIKYFNGQSYRGSFQNDKKSGFGEETFQQNLHYKGEFQNDLRHGWGTLQCENKIIFQGFWLNNTAVDQKKGKFQTIIEEEPSINENIASKQSFIKKTESNVSLLRDKFMQKKLQKFRKDKSLSQQKSKQLSEQKKPFRRACNCQRHRLKYQMMD